MSSPHPQVAVVIVSYTTGQMVLDHLPAILRDLQSCADGHVYVVDNLSPNADAELLAQAINDSEAVTFIAAPENGGFSYGNNRGIERALAEGEPDYIWLVNPDAYPREGCLAAMLERFKAEPKAGIVGSRLEDPDGTPQRSAFRFMSAASEFERTARTGPISSALSRHVVAPPVRDEAHKADWVCGASMLIRREVIDTIGPMDERYFLYYEETDFQKAAWDAGFEVWYEPAARAVHLVGQATDMKDQKQSTGTAPKWWFESRHYYMTKNHGPRYARLSDAAFIGGRMIGTLRDLVEGRGLSPAKSDISGVLTARKGNSGVPPTDDTAAKGTRNQNPSDIGYWALVAEDRRSQEHGLSSQGFWALFCHRFGNWRMDLPKPLRVFATILYRVWHKLVQIMGGIDLPYTVRVGRRVRIEHFGGMILIAEAIGNDVTIRQNTTFGVRDIHAKGNPVIEDGVSLGCHVCVLGPVTIGEGAQIGAGAVVISDIPAGATAIGTPAKVIS